MNYTVNTNLADSFVSREMREKNLGQKGCVIWFTGLSGSGKTTLANSLDLLLNKNGFKSTLLDGDILRDGINKDLGFSKEDRNENIRRIGHIAKIMSDAGLIVICSFISPYEESRQFLKTLIGEDKFFQVYLNSSLSACETRDPKGIYKKARGGTLRGFTGIDSEYEIPFESNLTHDISNFSATESIKIILQEVLFFIRQLEANTMAFNPALKNNV
jgi:adenylyl-sulfate kinase